ncbi:hypothetical protein GYMLUDRAFT_47189 [Collybiopsis luxurians FD-317 M1]|uniref:Uncharacterized protein n=1 Tax=Collybiopsis luxurians FD-317 M1 TaxID=944289 RepID=A0A0D0CEG6_9AGAR|nr:hypothetical protein GYMLUDRAFT_47189 [Collybiopsis luxurians FD-317 M1]
MPAERYRPYGCTARRRRREEALNELRLAQTIAEEHQEQKVEPQDDYDDDLLYMLVVLVILRILNAILMEVALVPLSKN